MKYGAETGSIVNHAISGASSAPFVNGPATVLYWTDRHAYTVIKAEGHGWHTLFAVAPVGGWPALEIFEAAGKTPALAGLIPIDRLEMLREVPSALYGGKR